MALNYLIGGADYVVANLWDVTDKDIDKLSMECMRTFFDSQSDNGISCAVGDGEGDSICGASSRLHSSATLCGALASSRAVCKLKNAVGCAPVVYGLPKIESTRKPEIK